MNDTPAPSPSGPSRRTTLALATAVGASTFLAAPSAVGAPTSPHESHEPHEQAARDASLRWRTLPTDWKDGAFLGNGLLGAVVTKGATSRTLKVMLSHTKVQDQRGQWRAAIGYSRLPVGYFTLTLAGEITAIDWTLDLYDAELRGSVTTSRGSVTFSLLVHNSRDGLVAWTEPSAGERSAAWSFTWLPAATPREKDKPPEYVANPDPATGTADGTHYVEQPLIAGGGWTTAWRERVEGTRRTLAAHVVYRHPQDLAGTTRLALKDVRRTLSVPRAALLAEHRAWWHRFHRRSFVSVPDKRIQDFYWIQLYKAASATRAGGPSLSEWGPWYPETGGSWSAVWWNLNVQIATWLIQGSNHPELDSVTSTFTAFEKNLPVSVPPEYRDGDTYALAHPSDWMLRPGEKTVGIPGTTTKTDNTGNLLWALHNIWLSYRHTMDLTVVRDVLYPILSRAVNFYDHFLYEGSDGALHLPLTRSPEWADAEDCTYDLSLVRWGCATLLKCLGLLRTTHPKSARWREILDRLTPYPRDATGVMIGAATPLTESHRHFSHMLWLYPLAEYDYERAADRAVIDTTFDHWVEDRSLWAGYSFACASSMASRIGRPDQALDLLASFTDGHVFHNSRMTENTMYVEGTNLAVESPLTAGQSVLDMMVQSHQGPVRVFPGVSARWPDASIQGLRTQGAFVIDADRAAGATRWVRVHSEAGSPLVLDHGIAGSIDVRDEHGRRLKFRATGVGRAEIALPKGATALVTPAGARAARPTPRDVPGLSERRPWGRP
ncbi:glycosyl hydrolase family 95 catalytic domain-containing protein [Streptomyces sp. NPDC102467]|uniref:glycosyl hydrolase family 95 catalytic domain-containing protein n=1 Tax=Streptomyces sp. NPDC102467 TaxID=3366179 RepID=UPI0037F9E911